MALYDRVHIARRFLRSIRIDSDLSNPNALKGFICPQTSADVLATMARHVKETGQGAFTWTGPYGSGKSSLVIALSALLSGSAPLRKRAAESIEPALVKALQQCLPLGKKGWRTIPVVGSRTVPAEIIGQALIDAGIVSREPLGGWTDDRVVQVTNDNLANPPAGYGGTILFIDEMGKFLEGAAFDGTDLYLFQQLAEISSRSAGRLLIVGILHQAFEEYAHRLSHEMRDEWAKIQGRFVDLAVNTAGEEQIDLISRAIESDHDDSEVSQECQIIGALAHRQREADADRLAGMLERCWPLHPVVASLLGPISRRRFGQNQRSIFGFLNSAEPHGFQDFLRDAADDDRYMPDRLWDYLRANLEPSILASPDGHRWALAAEALERCEAIGGDELHIKLLKTIAIVDLFKERAALLPRFELLGTCFPSVDEGALKKALGDLSRWSFTTFRKFADAHAIFAGSDFDIDRAVRSALEEIDVIDFRVLRSLAGLHPILAKRHYHKTGTMRWFDVSIAPVSDIVERASNYHPDSGTIGQFVLAIPEDGESEEFVMQACREAARQCDEWDTIVGFSGRTWGIVRIARELLALENVRNTRPELAGDSVARREVTARLAELQGQLEAELQKAFSGALWFRKHHKPQLLRQAELNGLASELAANRFDSSPILHSELLNRHRPSSSAVAAQNNLLRRMVLNEGKERLGIEGYPAEGGLFSSVLEATGLYRETENGWHFFAPEAENVHRLAPLWEAAREFIRGSSDRAVSIWQIYDLWRKPPFGVKDGLLPILSVAFVLSERATLAIYRDGVFRARFDDVDVDYLAKDASIIHVRWMDLSDVARSLLSGMAQIVRTLDSSNTLEHLEPIDVARGLVGIYEKLPRWTQRTMRLSANAIRVRDLFKRARDPNQFLFDDIPAVAGVRGGLDTKSLNGVITSVGEGLDELVQAYPAMLHRLRDSMLSELQVPNLSPRALAELRSRADNIREISGDFHTEAFVGRLSQFDGSDASFEAIASLTADKPPRDWVDPDLDRAAIRVAELSQKFLRAETFARVKGRNGKRHAMAVVVGLEGQPAPFLEEFEITDSDREAVDELIGKVGVALESSDKTQRRIILAALAELSARFMQKPAPTKTAKKVVAHLE
jgi:hypothetical protein